jgi:hypothetical protein
MRCSESECDREAKWRGLCQRHYLKDQYKDRVVDRDVLAERFWKKVSPTGFCWEWTAATLKARGGYGVFGWNELGRNVTVYAHRFAYEMLVGPIPAGMQLDHLCRNHVCVNPDHLEPVAPGTNTSRGFGPTGKGRGRPDYEDARLAGLRRQQ